MSWVHELHDAYRDPRCRMLVCLCLVAYPDVHGACRFCGWKVTATMHPEARWQMEAKFPAIREQRVLPEVRELVG